MKKKILAVTCGLCMLVAIGACQKKQEQPAPGTPGQEQQLPPGHPTTPQQGMGMPQQGMGMPQQGMQQPNIIVPKGETSVVVPASVQGKWKSVVLAIENKETGKTSDYTVNLHSEFKIPNTDLKVTVGDFLPDFRMEGLLHRMSREIPRSGYGYSNRANRSSRRRARSGDFSIRNSRRCTPSNTRNTLSS
jgi:hypothetical protein